MKPATGPELLRTLAQFQSDDFDDFIYRLTRDSYWHGSGLVLDLGDRHPGLALPDILRGGQGTDLGYKTITYITDEVRKAIGRLIVSWDQATGLQHQLRELLLAAGSMVLDEKSAPLAYQKILDIARAGTARNRANTGIDIHYASLLALFVISSKPEIAFLARRYLVDPRYSAVCFRKLTELEPASGPYYLPTLIACAINQPAIDIETTLRRYYLALGFDQFCSQLQDTCRLLLSERPADNTTFWNVYLTTLSSIGVQVDYWSFSSGYVEDADGLREAIPDDLFLANWNIGDDGIPQESVVEITDNFLVEQIQLVTLQLPASVLYRASYQPQDLAA